MSKWEQINSWLKQHYLCVMAWFVVVLIALAVVMAGNNKELVGYCSFAGSLSGILLALVVIIHTWIDSADTRTVLTEVKSHLTDIRGDVGKTAELIQSDILQSLLGKEKQSTTDTTVTEQSIQSSQIENIPFSFSCLRLFHLLVFYSASKMFQSGKEVDIADYLKHVYSYEYGKLQDGNSSTMFTGILRGAYVGSLRMMEGLLGLNEITSEGNIIKVNTFPSDIQRIVESELNKKLQLPSTSAKSVEKFNRLKNLTDSYFANL